MPQKFTVPQFIDIEDKILGPITTRQFIIIIVASMMAFLGYKLFDFGLFIAWAIIWLGGAAIISFVKINGMAFHYFLLNMIQTVKRSPIRVWNKDLSPAQLRALAFRKEEVVKKEEIPTKAPLSLSSLSELSLIADTGGSYAGENVLDTHEINVTAGKISDKKISPTKKVAKKGKNKPFTGGDYKGGF